MKKALLFCLVFLCMWSLVSCGEHVSSYSATWINKSQHNDHCELTFGSLSGRVVLQSKKTQGGSEGAIQYFGTLESGEIYVYYDTDMLVEKELLFHLTAGETLEASEGYIEKGQRVYIIVETVGTATNGEIRIDLG